MRVRCQRALCKSQRPKTLGGQGSGLLSGAVLLLNPEHIYFLF